MQASAERGFSCKRISFSVVSLRDEKAFKAGFELTVRT